MSEFMEKTVESIEDLKTQVNEAQKKAENDAEGSEVANALFNGITDNIMTILRDPKAIELYNVINKELNEASVGAIINLLSICMSTSAYNAIVFYDELLKVELNRQIDNIIDHTNDIGADLNGIKAAMQIHTVQIGKINKMLEISNFMKKNDISPEDLEPAKE